jgi:prevent-host-death family protein
MGLKRAIRPITDLKNHTAELVDEVARERHPLVITQHGEAKAVLMDMASFDRWHDTLALLKILALGQRQVETGRTLSQEATFKRVADTLRKKRK